MGLKLKYLKIKLFYTNVVCFNGIKKKDSFSNMIRMYIMINLLGENGLYGELAQLT